MSSAEKRIREMTKPSAASIVVAMFAGAIAGATTGLMAGPLGAAVGAVLGSAMGASAGLTMEFMETVHRRHEERLDREIGVVGGNLGVGERLAHPQATAGGLYSMAAAGSMPSSVVRAPDEGPMPGPG